MTERVEIAPGVLAEVVSDAGERANVVICALVAELPEPHVPNSYQTTCVGCFKMLWVAPSAPLTPPKACFKCAMAMVNKQ